MDEDFALALSLQFDAEDGKPEFFSNFENHPSLGEGLIRKNVGQEAFRPPLSAACRPLSVVDESWELIDPVPNIRDLFLQFNDAYFGGKLAGVEVKWSSKMTLCAGVCSYEGRGGLCSIRLSEPLLKLRPRKDLVQTLLHEMIHALLFVTQNNKDHDSHGPEFHKHMYRINKQSGANITVYHSFHDEVNNYRQHWWKCDGPCKSRPPFYGVVRRSMNRAPSKNDTWWYEHLRTCGGTFHKIKEPIDYGKKSSKRKREEDKGKESITKVDDIPLSKSQDISKWFKPDQNSGKTAIRTINDDSSNETKDKKPLNVFSGKGRFLVSDKSPIIISRDEWIDRLMQKQSMLSKGNDYSHTLDRKKLHSEKEPMQLGGTSTVSLRVSRDEKENRDFKNRGVDCFDSNRKTSQNEDSGFPLASASGDSSEQPFVILSSTVSSAISPSILPLPVKPSTSLSNANTPTNMNAQNYGKREKSTIVIEDSSPTQPILELIECPACPQKIPIDSINLHLDQCLCR